MRIKREALARSPKFKRLAAKGRSAQTPVDRTGGMHGAGLISGVSLTTRGEALGHGLWLDEEFVASVADGVNQFDQGVKSRYTHPDLSADGLGKHLGRAMNATVDGDQARGDFHFTKASHKAPDGDLSGHVMDMAEESPEDFATSIVYEPDYEAELEHFLAHGGRIVEDPYTGWDIWDTSEFQSPDPKNKANIPHARLAAMVAVDFVGDPAANPGGLFSREQKFAEEAEQLASFALGLSDKRPAAVALGLDADRVEQFVQRFLTRNKLEIVPMRKQNDQKPADDKPAEQTPAAEAKPAEQTPATQQPTASEKPAEEAPASETPAAEPAAALSAMRAEAKRFREAFGDKGAVWFAEGLDFEQARARQLSELRTENEQLKTQLGEVKKKLSAAGGEQTPVEFDGGAEEKKRGGFASKIRIVGAAAK